MSVGRTSCHAFQSKKTARSREKHIRLATVLAVVFVLCSAQLPSDGAGWRPQFHSRTAKLNLSIASNESVGSGAPDTASAKLGADEATATNAQPAPDNWQGMLDRAEPIYAAGNYTDALPIYKEAVDAAASAKANAADLAHCLRYLADCYCRVKQPEEALKQYERIEGLLTADDVDGRATNLNDEALCYELQQDWDKSEALCRSALKICTEAKPENQWQISRTYAHLGYIQYMCAKYAAAIPLLQQAEHYLDLTGRDDLLAVVFRQKIAFGQAGTYYHLKRYADASKQFKRVYDLDVRLFGHTNLQTGWMMLAMSDVLAKIGQPDQAKDWYSKSVYVFRMYNRDRLCKEYAGKSTPTVNVEQSIDHYVFGNSTMPKDLQDTQAPLCKDDSVIVNTHDPRSAYVRPFTDAPGRAWLDPFVKQRGIVIAVHGLSLNHSSYDQFATQIAKYGFCTVAFDVRGFGSYRQALGAERIDFEGCLNDLELVVKAIKANNPDMPVFILGESMGGAIALQFTARNPELVDGLISSVPAGKRFKERRTVFKVAKHFLQNKNQPFDIGTDVINQATHNPRVKEAWTDDPNTRKTLSPEELIAFQSMCNRNLEAAKQITKTPVMIFQGVSDMLVKPEATYDLFRAITCKDKSLVMVGNAEHLIFEEGCFTPAVLKGVVAWMESHS
jgi:lysophospholipase